MILNRAYTCRHWGHFRVRGAIRSKKTVSPLCRVTIVVCSHGPKRLFSFSFFDLWFHSAYFFLNFFEVSTAFDGTRGLTFSFQTN